MMLKKVLILFPAIFFFLFCHTGMTKEKCVEATGEAVILNKDTPSAIMEATARAKWAAIEQVVGIEVKEQSIIQNSLLVDEVVKTQAGGVVKSFQVLEQRNNGDVVAIKINACVEPSKAQQLASSLALNNSISVFIPTLMPNTINSLDGYDETNIFSETLIEKLTNQNYKVMDIAPTHAVGLKEIEDSIKTGSTIAVRSMVYKFLSNVIIIGKVEFTISTKKGEDIGYGISMPFNNVTVRLTYRIVAKNNKTDNMEILSSGSEDANGLANSVEDAAATALKNLSDKVVPVILDKIAKYIQDNVKKISIRIAGVTDLDTNMDAKQTLQNVVWVSDVEEKRIGEFIVAYPENSLYLANSLRQKGVFTIVDYSPYSISLEYKKP